MAMKKRKAKALKRSSRRCFLPCCNHIRYPHLPLVDPFV
jgi:hypothetical protein